MKIISALPKWLLLELAIPITILNGWLVIKALQYLQPLISTLVIATLLSFLLDYPIQKLQDWGVKRGFGIAIVFLSSLAIAAIIGILLVPVLLEQFQELITALPNWIESGNQQLQTLQSWAIANRLPIDVGNVFTEIAERLPDGFQNLPDQILIVVSGAFDRAVELVLVIVFTFYLLLHGDSFWKGLFRWFPADWRDQVSDILSKNFKRYFLGQLAIATIGGTALSIVFWLLNVPYWSLFGLGIGATMLIPFADILAIAAVVLLMSLKSIWLGGKVLLAAVIIDQIIDNGITPRILGELVGLNPIWILIVLLIGAKAGGLVGMVLAVPLAGSIKSLADYWGDRYSIPSPEALAEEVSAELEQAGQVR